MIFNIDEQISKAMGWWSSDGTDWYPERTAKVKQLLRDYTKEIVNGEWDSKTWAQDAYWKGYKDAITTIETNAKRMLGDQS